MCIVKCVYYIVLCRNCHYHGVILLKIWTGFKLVSDRKSDCYGEWVTIAHMHGHQNCCLGWKMEGLDRETGQEYVYDSHHAWQR